MEKSVQEVIREQLEIKGISPAKLHQLTNIPERYLTGILEMDDRNVPALPYLRGYLLKIGGVLDLNGPELWKKYQREAEIQSSGLKDRLPENRYSLKAKKRKWLIPTVLAVLLAGGYLVLNAGNIFGNPSLTVYSPAENILITASAIYNVAGKIDSRDILKINNEEIVANPDGEFNEFYNLQPGQNTFTITVKRLLGKETKVVKQIIYNPTIQKP